jgi:hypothetical protein
MHAAASLHGHVAAGGPDLQAGRQNRRKTRRFSVARRSQWAIPVGPLPLACLGNISHTYNNSTYNCNCSCPKKENSKELAEMIGVGW